MGRCEISRQLLASDVFGHTHAHNRVVKLAAVCRDLAIIAQLDLRLACQSSFDNPGAAPFCLRFTQCDSLRSRTAMFRGVNNESAPPTANVEVAPGGA